MTSSQLSAIVTKIKTDFSKVFAELNNNTTIPTGGTDCSTEPWCTTVSWSPPSPSTGTQSATCMDRDIKLSEITKSEKITIRNAEFDKYVTIPTASPNTFATKKMVLYAYNDGLESIIKTIDSTLNDGTNNYTDIINKIGGTGGDTAAAATEAKNFFTKQKGALATKLTNINASAGKITIQTDLYRQSVSSTINLLAGIAIVGFLIYRVYTPISIKDVKDLAKSGASLAKSGASLAKSGASLAKSGATGAVKA